MLKITNLSKQYGELNLFSSADLVVEKNTISILTGFNGSGKTTLFHMITGYEKPQEGEILFKGDNLIGKNPFEIARKGVGRLFQDIRIFDELSVIDNLKVGKVSKQPLNILITNSSNNYKSNAGICDVLNFISLHECRFMNSNELSYGQQKLLSIGRLLIDESELLLLDEPLSGLSIEMKEKIIEKIFELKTKKGKTIVIIEHETEEIEKIADKLYFINDAKIKEKMLRK